MSLKQHFVIVVLLVTVVKYFVVHFQPLFKRDVQVNCL